jgi:glycosyltransferase involved in cell wall biosynthesis
MKLAFFSPLNPEKSGISDFSEEILPHMHPYMDIDVFANKTPTNPMITENFTVYPIESYDDAHIRGRYDFSLFHIGNNILFHEKIMEMFLKYGGVLELHDISLHNFMAAYTLERNAPEHYLELMAYCHGAKGQQTAQAFLEGKLGAAPWESHPLEFTMSKHLIDQASAVIAHSDFAKQMVKGVAVNKPVVSILLHTADITDSAAFRTQCRNALKIPESQLMLASFGFASNAKRMIPICQALAQYKRLNPHFHYYIVGKNQMEDLPAVLSNLGLADNVTIIGFTDLDAFKMYMGACDIPLNLRYPTCGESSGSLHRLFGFGKAVIVTNAGAFQEYPDRIALKVSHGDHEVRDIVAAIKLLANSEERERRGQEAVAYARRHFNLEHNARLYKDFFTQLCDGWIETDPLDRLAGVMIEMDLTEDSYIKHVVGNCF